MPGTSRGTLFAAFWTVLLASQAWALPRVDITASLAPELHSALSQSLNLPALTSGGSLDREARRLTELVRAFGYLDGKVRIEQSADVLAVNVQPGPLYLIGSIQIPGLGGTQRPALQADIHDLIVANVGTAARADIISRLAREVVWRARSASFALAHGNGTDIVADPITETAALTIRTTTGPPIEFGDVTFDSDGIIDPAVLYPQVPFSTGDAYSPVAIEALDTALADLPLLRQRRIELLPVADERVTVAVTLRTRADLGMLGHRKAIGILMLGLALLAIGLRQLALETGFLAWSPPVRLVSDATIAMTLIGALALSAERALAFAGVV